MVLFFGLSFGQNHSLFYSQYENDKNWTTVNLATSNNGNNGIITINSSGLSSPFSSDIDSVFSKDNFFVFTFSHLKKEYGLIVTKDFQTSVFVDATLVDSPFYKPLILNYVDHRKINKQGDGLNLESLMPLLKLFMF